MRGRIAPSFSTMELWKGGWKDATGWFGGVDVVFVHWGLWNNSKGLYSIK